MEAEYRLLTKLINEQAKGLKNDQVKFEDLYFDVFLETLPTEKEPYNAAISNYLHWLAINNITLKYPLSFFDFTGREIGELKIEPVSVKPLKTTGIESLKTIAAKKDELSPKTESICFADNDTVACDGFVLVVLKDIEHEYENNKMFNLRTKEYLNEKVYDYQGMYGLHKQRALNFCKELGIPYRKADIEEEYLLDNELIGWLECAVRTYKNIQTSRLPTITLSVAQARIKIDARLLIKVLKVLQANGVTIITLILSEMYNTTMNSGAALKIETDKGHWALISPVANSANAESECDIPIFQMDGEVQKVDTQKCEEAKKRKVLGIDIETYSPIDLLKSGVYPYAEGRDFEILLFAYAFDDEPVQMVDLAQGELIPTEVRDALENPQILKTAWNAQFERVCMKNKGLQVFINEWECTMVKAAMLGLPLSLDAASKAVGLSEEKMASGKALINYFSKPCKPTRTNGERTRNLPHHDPDKWELFKKYCKQDVEVERAIRNKIAFFQIPEQEKELYVLDQSINDRGVRLDVEMVENAIRIDNHHREKLIDEAVKLTGLDNPNSVAQLRDWVEKETDEEVDGLRKGDIPDLIKSIESDKVKRVLELRQELSKTSVKKYTSMINAARENGRVGGLLQFYGANRTGRWAGRLVQVQNLPQNHLPDLDTAREMVKAGDGEMLEMMYGSVPDTLSQLIRTAFIGGEDKTFVVADFSAIEARVIAWLAGEKWRLDVFNSHGKIYEASAAQMFKVPIEEVTKGSPLRQKGKVAELALGYQGGANALIAMGALKMGLTEDDLKPLVDAWRGANKAIVQLWDIVNKAAIHTIEERSLCTVINRNIAFSYKNNIFSIELPSGRKLSYLRPQIGENRFGSKSIIYEGMDQTTKKWCKQETYGGKLVENIVQAIARDCLAEAMLEVDRAMIPIVMHIHDEIVVEALKCDSEDVLERLCTIMGKSPAWAPELPLRGDGYITDYYKKD